jgi:bifunctional DNA-binding transcriptional regulator/antitoxin component of YhaV-PrlF toxin-antitoxin module
MRLRSNGGISDREAATISRLGPRRQVTIPKNVCDELGLRAGDFVEARRAGNAAVIKRKRPVEREDLLTPKEAALVRKGERQLARGEFITLDEFEKTYR